MPATAVSEIDDATLVERCRQGDRASFETLHRRYERLVGSVVRAESRRGGGGDVDDIVQDVFVLAWQRMASLRDPERFRPWLLQITRRTIIDHARRAARRPVLDQDDDLMLEWAAAESAGPDELAELADLAARLSGALEGLSRRDATAISLAVQFGFGPVEIGEALGITPNNAKVVLHRARARLRASIA